MPTRTCTITEMESHNHSQTEEYIQGAQLSARNKGNRKVVPRLQWYFNPHLLSAGNLTSRESAPLIVSTDTDLWYKLPFMFRFSFVCPLHWLVEVPTKCLHALALLLLRTPKCISALKCICCNSLWKAKDRRLVMMMGEFQRKTGSMSVLWKATKQQEKGIVSYRLASAHSQ